MNDRIYLHISFAELNEEKTKEKGSKQISPLCIVTKSFRHIDYQMCIHAHSHAIPFYTYIQTHEKFSTVIKLILNINLLDPGFPLNFIMNDGEKICFSPFSLAKGGEGEGQTDRAVQRKGCDRCQIGSEEQNFALSNEIMCCFRICAESKDDCHISWPKLCS